MSTAMYSAKEVLVPGSAYDRSKNPQPGGELRYSKLKDWNLSSTESFILVNCSLLLSGQQRVHALSRSSQLH